MWTTLHIFLKTKKTSVFKWVNSYGSKSPHALNEPGLSASEIVCIELLYHSEWL